MGMWEAEGTLQSSTYGDQVVSAESIDANRFDWSIDYSQMQDVVVSGAFFNDLDFVHYDDIFSSLEDDTVDDMDSHFDGSLNAGTTNFIYDQDTYATENFGLFNLKFNGLDLYDPNG